jgi:histone H2A
MSARGGKKRQKAMSKSQRANVTFPVGRLYRYLKMGTHRLRIGVGSPVYMAAVIEYLTGMTRQRKLDLKKYEKIIRVSISKITSEMLIGTIFELQLHF